MSQIGNSLTPPPQAGDAPEGHEPMMEAVQQAHSQAAAQLGKLTEAKGMVDHIRSALEGLAAQGDNVDPEDVIKATGGIVAKGGDPMQLASLLADMPQGGQAIAAWVSQHATALGQNEAKLDQQLALDRHSAGAAALHLIAMHHIGEQFKKAAAQSQAGVVPPGESSNALN